MIKIFIVGGNYGHYASWIKDHKLVDTPQEADVLFFTGGEDITPMYYGENKGKFTSCNSKRDEVEFELFKRFPKTLKWGTCRGAQFLTVASGGKLIQHVTGHGGCTHEILDIKSKEKYRIPSTHHQMVYPFDIEHEMIAVATPQRSSVYLNGDNEEINLPMNFVETEIVYYPQTNSIAKQGHAEMCTDERLHEYLNKLLLKYLK